MTDPVTVRPFFLKNRFFYRLAVFAGADTFLVRFSYSTPVKDAFFGLCREREGFCSVSCGPHADRSTLQMISKSLREIRPVTRASFFALVSFLIFIFRNQIVNIILQHGQFSQVSAQLTSASLGIFCLGLWASALIPLMLRGFFALQDTKTPTLIAVLTVLLNVGLSFSLVSLLGTNSRLWFWLVKTFNLGAIYDIRILGLVLAFSISAIFQFFLSIIFLKKKSETV